MLSAFTVDVDVRGPGAMDAYASRLRSGIEAGVTLAAIDSFDTDELSESTVPEWLAEISSSSPNPSILPAEVVDGRRRYVSAQEEEAWELQDWLWCFEPGKRQWEWWDVTAAGGTHLLIWLDSKGESAYPCEDVRWLAYVAGAWSVSGPIILPRIVWEVQTSLGLPHVGCWPLPQPAQVSSEGSGETQLDVGGDDQPHPAITGIRRAEPPSPGPA